MLQKKEKIDSLQILRTIAFFEIFLGHCGILFFTGAFGVSIFLVLSGFCMTINYLPKTDRKKVTVTNSITYALSKVKKLYGLHLFMLGCAFFLAGMPHSTDAIRRLILDGLLLQSWSPHGEDYFSYNGVSWYLSVYLFISMASPLIVSVLSKMKKKIQVLLSMVLIFGIMLVVGAYVTANNLPIGDNFAFWLTYISPVYRLLEFFLGAALGWFFVQEGNKPLTNRWKAAILEIFAAAAFVGIICIFHRVEGKYDGLCYTALFTPVSMLLVLVFAYSRGVVMKLLHNKFFLWLGNLSSYTFLIHQVVIRWLVTILSREQLRDAYTFVLTILSFGITVIGAELVSFIIKKSGGSHGKRISGICNF